MATGDTTRQVTEGGTPEPASDGTATWGIAAFAGVQQTIGQLSPAVVDPGQHSSREVGAAEILAALTQLRALQEQLTAWEPMLIGAARDRGASWAAIAPALGVASRQAAERRYLRLNPHTTDRVRMTGEQRVQAARDRRAGERAVTQWARTNAAKLRRLAAQITALDNLDAGTQHIVDQVLHALGDPDTARLLAPLAEAGPKLRHSHPRLAEQVADINQTTEHLRSKHTTRTH